MWERPHGRTSHPGGSGRDETCTAFFGGAHSSDRGPGQGKQLCTCEGGLALPLANPRPLPRTVSAQSTFLPALTPGSPTVGGFLPDTLQQACPSRQSTGCPMSPEKGREGGEKPHSFGEMAQGPAGDPGSAGGSRRGWCQSGLGSSTAAPNPKTSARAPGGEMAWISYLPRCRPSVMGE